MTVSDGINFGGAVISLLVALIELVPRLRTHSKRRQKKKAPSPKRHLTDVVETLEERRLRSASAAGLPSAQRSAGASVTWRSVDRRARARLDVEVAVVNYFVAGVTLLVWVPWSAASKGSRQSDPVPSVPRFLAASLLKAINTYCWILAVSTILAAAASALENTHPLWAALPLVILFGVRLPKDLIYGSASSWWVPPWSPRSPYFNTLSAQGLAAALISGVAFAGFYVLWAGKGDRPPLRSQRAIEMGTVMSMACLLLFPIHMLASALSPSIAPAFGTLPPFDLLLQSVNGLIGIGLTYLLVGEALLRMRSVGTASSFLLGFAMSCAVPMTLTLEALILRTPVEPFQWMGAGIFFFGFFFVGAEIDETLRHRPLHIQAMSMS